MSYFEKLTDGLQLHEVAMFVLGGLLFVVLLFLIVLFALRKRQLKPLLLFFIIPIVMLGWPSIAKIQLNNEGITLDKNLRELQKNPDDETLKSKVEQSIQVLEEKGVSAPDRLADIARAKYLLGEDKGALETLRKIPEADKAVLGVTELQQTITVTQDLRQKIEEAKASPTPESLEILETAKTQVEADHKFKKNARLQGYVLKSDSLIRKNR